MFSYTDEQGERQELDLDINDLLTVRWNDGKPLGWHDREGVPGVFSHEVLANVPAVIKNVNDMRKSAEYDAASREWLVNNGHEVSDKNLSKGLGVGVKKISRSNNPLNVKNVIYGEITDQTETQVIITIHPPLPEEERKSNRITKSDLQAQNEELQATIDRIRAEHGLE